MESSVLLRQLLRTPSAYRFFLAPPIRPQSRTFALLVPHGQLPHPRYISLPRIIQPSFWASMIPRPFKERPASKPSKEWNPATPYIILGLLVGSQAIQIIWLKQERGHEKRKAEAKIGILKEVIERVQRGEDVDVERVLGTGDKEQEAEWAEVIKEIEEEELLFQSKKKRRAIRKAAEEEEKAEQRQVAGDLEKQDSSPTEDGKVKVEAIGGAKFY